MSIINGEENKYAKYGQPTLDLVFTGPKKSLTDRVGNVAVGFARTTTATYVGSDGLIKTAAVDEARFDHDPVTGESLGLLVEESRTNIQLNSAAPYSSGGSQIVWTTGLTAPDGTSTAVKLAATAVDTQHFRHTNIYPGASFPNGTYTYSVHAKRDGLNRFSFKGPNLTSVTFDLSTGTVVAGAGGTITPAGNGWYRCSVTEFTNNSSYQYGVTLNADDETGFAPFLGDGTSGIILWGLQMEAGSFPTSYIPTSGSTVTRGADVADMTGTNFSSWYNQSEGTFVASFDANGRTGAGRIIGSNAGQTPMYLDTDTTISSFGNAFVGASVTVPSVFDVRKAGIAYESSTQQDTLVVDGGTPNTSTNSGNFAGYGASITTSIQLFSYPSAPSYTTGHISRITYWPTRLPDSDLQSLTE